VVLGAVAKGERTRPLGATLIMVAGAYRDDAHDLSSQVTFARVSRFLETRLTGTQAKMNGRLRCF